MSLRSFRAEAVKTRWKWYLHRLRLARGKSVRVCYAHYGFPNSPPYLQTVVRGGAVKYQYLHQYYPHAGLSCHILYIISSSHCPISRLESLVRTAKAKGIRIVLNQNGVYVPYAFEAEKVTKGNKILTFLLQQADYVLYQSEFARLSSNRFLGSHRRPSEVLYNAVDTSQFRPNETSRDSKFTLLVAGSHNDSYRLTVAIRTLAILAKQRSDVRMIVAGHLPTTSESQLGTLIKQSQLEERIEFMGLYDQMTAPEFFNKAHILLHTQYNDVCPTVVIEAMACGLPVIYSRSGGTPELVGDEAGIGVSAPFDWDQAHPPKPELLAQAILEVAEKWPQYSAAARQRAVERFDLHSWLRRHKEVFDELAS